MRYLAAVLILSLLLTDTIPYLSLAKQGIEWYLAGTLRFFNPLVGRIEKSPLWHKATERQSSFVPEVPCAGQEGIEPSIRVLETPVIPFNYWPISTCLRTSGSRRCKLFLKKQHPVGRHCCDNHFTTSL